MYAHARRLLALPLVAAFVLAGCSNAAGPGAGGGTLPAPSSNVTSARRHGTTTTLSIRIPKKVRIRGGRNPRFVSPSTQSASISIAPAAGCTSCTASFGLNIGLTPASPNCAASSTGTVCTFALVLTPGTYTGSMTTYDGPIAAGSPTGSVLSLDQAFPLTVTSGKANTPTIALYGVPASIMCLPVTAASISISETVVCNQGIIIVSPGVTSSFAVYALDVDGNLMLGPGAPTFAASGAAGFTFATKGNTISVTPPTIATTLYLVTIAATSPACSVTGAVCSFTDALAFDSVVAIPNSGNNTVSLVSRLALSAGAGAPYATVANGVSGPVAVAFDKNGDLFVVNGNNNSVTEYAPPYTGAPTATMTTNLNLPYALAIGSNGVVGVLNGGTATAEVFAPPYTSAPKTVTLSSSSATSLAFDTSENLWVAFFSSTVQRYSAASSYAAIDYLLDAGSNLIDKPTAVLVDASNNLYVGENKIDEFQGPNYTGHPTLSSSALTNISSMTFNGTHGQIAACSNTGVSFYNSITLDEIYNFVLSQGGCSAAFDRLENLDISFSNPDGALSFTYDSELEFWSRGRTYAPPALSTPAGIATWP